MSAAHGVHLPGRGRRWPALPAAVLAGLASGLAGLGVAAAAAVMLLLAGRPAGQATLVAALGAAVAAAAAGAAGACAARTAVGLRLLQGDALRRLQGPDAPLASAATARILPADSSQELVELARALHALQLRARVADEVAERYRQTAQASSAGMFELLAGLVAAEESARGQLAAELHDTVAQSLLLARAALAADVSDGPARASTLVEEAEEQVRAVMARTRPPALRDGDLATAVAGLRDDLHRRYGLTVHVSWPVQPQPLPLAAAVTVYRFFQEALLNVVKHADADEAAASLEVDDDGLVAIVSDAGPGFDPAAVRAERGRHVGLGLLRERARLAGGVVAVTSRPGGSTTLTLRLPAGQGRR